MSRTDILLLFAAVAVLACQGCGKIQGPDFPVIPSPRVIVATPAGPASGNITITFQVIDRERDPVDVAVQYSTDGGHTFSDTTLVAGSRVTNLESDWYPGEPHSVEWDSSTDMVGRSGDTSACLKITPSDGTNPDGSLDISGSFTVNNIAYNETPTATVSTPAGVQSGNIQINYFLSDVEGDACSIAVDFSTNGGSTYQTATMGPAGDGLSGLSSSPSGTAHTFLWDSRTDNVGLTAQQDNVKIRITPTDFNEGTAGETNNFSVDNTTPNIPPTVNITSGPSQGSTVYTDQVTFGWSGSDTDGTVTGYYYSFDQDPPDVWTTNTSVTSGVLSEESHTFRVAAMDDEGALSTVASRTFTYSAGIIQAAFTGSPVSGTAPLAVAFTDTSTSTSGITSWLWNFGDGGTSSAQNPQHAYSVTGSYTVALTVTGPDGSDTNTKTSYITVSSITSGPIYGWTRVAGDTSDEVGYDIATDQSGNIYVTGLFGGTVDFGADFGTSESKISQGQSDVFIMKIASNGAYGWTRVAGSLSVDVGHAVIVSPLGCVYATGHFRGTVDFGADFGTSDSKTSVGGGDIFIMKVNVDGSYGWTKAMTGGTYDYGYGIAADQSGNLYVTGRFEETVDFGADFGTPDSKTAQGDDDVFITRINADDSYGWTKTMGGGMFDIGTDVTVDGSGNIYIVGYFESTVDFGADFGTTDSKISQGAYDVFITKIGSGGTYSWTRRIGGTGFDRAYDIAVGSSGGVYATGYFCDTVDFGADFGATDIKTSNGDGDIFITKVSPDGSYCWSKVMGSTGYDEGNSIATDQSGNVYATGRFGSTVDFGADFGQSDSKTSQGECDIFITKIASDGTYGWSKAMGGARYDYGFGIASDSSGNVITTGRFELTVDFGTDFGTSDSKTSQGNYDIFVTKIGQPAVSRNWIQKSPANKPSARYVHSMAYDSTRGVVVMFGGEGFGRYDDTWEYEGTSWVQKNPVNEPSARSTHSMVYDSSRGVVVLFGGRNSGGSYLDDTWEYDGANWVQKSPANKPHTRQHHSMAYDSSRGVVVLFSGYCGWYLDDTWEYDGTDWVQKSPANKPSERRSHSMAYDSSRDVVVLFGGWRGGNSYFDETWEYDGTDWAKRIPANKPSARGHHPMDYDSSRGVIVLFGGSYYDGTRYYYQDTWEYDGTDWMQKSPANKPPARYSHSMVYDSSRGVMVLFGGHDGGSFIDDTWEY